MEERKMRPELIRKALAWQVIGLVCGTVGSIVLGALLGLVDPSSSWIKAIAAGAVVHLGIYLSSFFIWLPTTIVLVAGSVAALARHPELARGKMRFAVGLTVLLFMVAFLLRFAVIPFSLPLLFAALWLTLVPPTFLLDLTIGGSKSDA
jgi:hypothetical protein